MASCGTGQEKIIFDLIGSYGPWQRRVLIVFCAAAVVGIWHSYAITFLAPNVRYLCVSASTNLYSHYGPSDSEESGTSLLHIFKNSSNQCVVQLNDLGNKYFQNGNETPLIACTAWSYDTSVYSQSIVSEWDLVCNREWLISFAKSIYMLGFLLSVLIFGQVSDSIGRLPAIIICYVITSVSALVTIFSNSYLMFVVLRFFLAFGRTGFITTLYVLLLEIIGPEYRTDLALLIQFSWSVGFMTLSALAWSIRHWFWLQLSMMVPVFPLAIIFWVVPESPRWLLTQNKTKKFLQVVKNAAEMNGRDFDEEACTPLLLTENKKEHGSTRKTIFDILTNSKLRKRWLIMAFLWPVCAFVAYSLTYNTNDLGGNPYLNFFFIGVMDFFGRVLTYVTRNCGRKETIMAELIFAGISCGANMVVPSALLWLTVATAVLTEFFISASFSLLYLYCMEMFPTVVRNIAIGSCSTCARVASIIAPFSRELNKATHFRTSSGISAGLAMSAGLLTSMLPETMDKSLPDTMGEVENFEKKKLKLEDEEEYEF